MHRLELELVIDSFAGGGGASLGIEQAIGRPVDIAINHDRAAIAMHEANHPGTRHYQEDAWQVDPFEATGCRPVALLWLSPDCTHHSKARGGKPRDKGIRGLAWVGLRWAARARPRVIILENVEEFRTCDVEWIRGIVRQCQAAGVAVFVKQLGAKPREHFLDRGEWPVDLEWCGSRNVPPVSSPERAPDWWAPVLSDRKGGDPAEWPEDLRVREFPEVGR